MKKLVAILLIVFLSINNVYAEEAASIYSMQINIASLTLRLFKNGSLIKEYPVAVGKPATKTPLGSFEIKNKVINPYWNNKGKVVAPGPKNPLGIRWMGISILSGTYGIHGNNVPSSIRTFASGGCIRMYNNDAEELYSLVGLKTTVQIIYDNIEVKQDKYTDTPILMVYPDVYKKKGAESLLKRLTANNKYITQEQVSRALKLSGSGISNIIAVCDGTAVILNNQFITKDAFVENEAVYIYYLAAMDLLGIDSNQIRDFSIPVIEKDNKIYVNLTQIVSKTGGNLKLDKINNNVYLSCSIYKINGKYLSNYTGDFDKERLVKSNLFEKLGIYTDAMSKEYVNLKELCNQRNWHLNSESISKIINIEIPLRVQVEGTYINTEFYDGRYYINCEEASNIPGILSQNFNQYSYKDKKYYDIYEIMSKYEYKSDYFFTTIEVLKLLDSEV